MIVLSLIRLARRVPENEPLDHLALFARVVEAEDFVSVVRVEEVEKFC